MQKLCVCHLNPPCVFVCAAETLCSRQGSERQPGDEAGHRANPSQHPVGQRAQGSGPAVVQKRSWFLEGHTSGQNQLAIKHQCLTHFFREKSTETHFSKPPMILLHARNDTFFSPNFTGQAQRETKDFDTVNEPNALFLVSTSCKQSVLDSGL